MTRHPRDIPVALTDEEIAAGVVCLMCGVAGSGKTTVARRLERRGLVRLSIDEYIWRNVGRYGVDYEAERYPEHQAAAVRDLDDALVALLRACRPVVLDYSFWQRSERRRYTALVEAHGRPWRLFFLDVAPDVVRARLVARRERFDADAAFPIDDELLDRYLAGFERPHGEGETVISVRG